MASKKSNKLLAVGLALGLIGVFGIFSGIALLTRYIWTPVETTQETNPDGNAVEITRPFNEDLFSHVSDPSVDDGELHDARTACEHYDFSEGFWARSDVNHSDTYGMDIRCEFAIKYPKLTGDIEKLDEINELLRSTAMKTVTRYYDDPSKQDIENVKKIVESTEEEYLPKDADALMSSTVDYAVSYNSDKLLSVCYSDRYCVGSQLSELIELRTLNINLETGEVYELNDVMTVDDAIANTFVDNLVRTDSVDENGDGALTDDECFTVALVGREALVEALQGKGELAESRVSTCLFVDGNGKPNLGANYWLSNEEMGFVRGWWDVTIPDDQLKDVRKDSTFWDLLEQ